MASQGKVIATEHLTRACGCEGDFWHYEDDPYREQRREKFLTKNCPVHAMRAAEEHNRQQTMAAKTKRAASTFRDNCKIRKGSEFKVLPIGCTIVLSRQRNGSWNGLMNTIISDPDFECNASSLLATLKKLAKMHVKSLSRTAAQNVTE